MAAKISWYEYRTKLRHCHSMYRQTRADTRQSAAGPGCQRLALAAEFAA